MRPLIGRASHAFAFLSPCFLVALLAATPATSNDLQVGNPWVSLPILDEEPAIYFAIANRRDAPRKITGASSPRCERIEIHRAAVQDGVMGSVELDEMEIPAGGAVAFAPRGLFLKMIGSQSLSEGENVPVELELDDGEKISFDAVVKDE
ncbi:MAG: copper chaperone PCu(A)C [Deltaproteobacteria bacterium]|jgi:copper(I)-binding protein|nr:copper chaperone PCu(A)C [Deltaproteobacteria bacterium]MBW2498603.1 copper chaperone PCu(A)C [Deltaproteobacteria bacterium]